MRFKPGEKVVCILRGCWYDSNTNEKTKGPQYSEIVTVLGYYTYRYIILKEYQYANPHLNPGLPDHYDDAAFAPLMDISELTEVLQQEPATV